ncbi:MAG: hypothetical protein ACJA2M_000315 [Polaribacter sp.]|jgi:hypothetical protein
MSAKKFLQDKYPQMRGDKWDSHETINDDWITIQMQEYANQELILKNKELLASTKNTLDLLNWAKSELKQATNTKLGKTITPYRSEKIIFLRKVVNLIKQLKI